MGLTSQCGRQKKLAFLRLWIWRTHHTFGSSEAISHCTGIKVRRVELCYLCEPDYEIRPVRTMPATL